MQFNEQTLEKNSNIIKSYTASSITVVNKKYNYNIIVPPEKSIVKCAINIKNVNKVNKTELSKIVAEKLAKKAQEKKITKIFFDRGVYKYHGRVKVFAETLRKNGMDF